MNKKLTFTYLNFIIVFKRLGYYQLENGYESKTEVDLSNRISRMHIVSLGALHNKFFQTWSGYQRKYALYS